MKTFEGMKILNCYKCGSKIKQEGNSLHVWDIEYECGCKIWGAIDTKIHGNNINILVKCKNDTNLK